MRVVTVLERDRLTFGGPKPLLNEAQTAALAQLASALAARGPDLGA